MIEKKYLLMMLFTSFTLLAQVASIKLILINELIISGGILFFIVSYLIIDELHIIDRKLCSQLINFNLLLSFLCYLFLYLISFLSSPTGTEYFTNAYDIISKRSFFVTCAGALSYFVSHYINIKIMKYKKNFISKTICYLIVQFIDCLIFGVIAFGFISPLNVTIIFIISQTIFKTIALVILHYSTTIKKRFLKNNN